MGFKNFGAGAHIRAGAFVPYTVPKYGRKVINKTGSSIGVDKLVAIVGYDTTANLPKIVLADANTSTHVDVYVTTLAIANDAEGHVYKGAFSVADLNTNSATTVGDPVYLSETAGGFVHTAPTAVDANTIPVGWVKVKSATVGQIFWAVGPIEKAGAGNVQGGENAEVVAAANVITAAENGKVFFLNAAAEFASTLPAPFLGAHYTFLVTGAPSGASYTVVTEGGCQVLAGSVHSSVLNDSGDFEAAATGTTITFVDGVAVVGDMAEVWSDGTSWFAKCFCTTGAAITITG